MGTLIQRIEQQSRVTNLSSKSWLDIVDDVVLPHMAGRAGLRYKIHDDYMNLLADFAYEIICKDKNLANELFEIALQRISCGAVLHGDKKWPEPLDFKYWEYSSKFDEDHVMTEGCFNFIMNAADTCLKHCRKDVKEHMLKILFGIIKHTNAYGEVTHEYYALADFKPQAADLYRHATCLVECYASFKELYRNYAAPGQWEKHKMWFSEHFDEINWNSFFKDTMCLKGNFFQRLFQKRRIKNELRILAIRVAS
jgi:hypothetical protein